MNSSKWLSFMRERSYIYCKISMKHKPKVSKSSRRLSRVLLVLRMHKLYYKSVLCEFGQSSQQHSHLIEYLPNRVAAVILLSFQSQKCYQVDYFFFKNALFYKSLNSKEVHHRISKFFWILNSLHSNSVLFIGILNDVLFFDSFWE